MVVFALLSVGSMLVLFLLGLSLALFFLVRLLGVVGIGAVFCVVLLVQLLTKCLGGRLVPPLKPNMAERLCEHCEDFMRDECEVT